MRLFCLFEDTSEVVNYERMTINNGLKLFYNFISPFYRQLCVKKQTRRERKA